MDLEEWFSFLLSVIDRFTRWNVGNAIRIFLVKKNQNSFFYAFHKYLFHGMVLKTLSVSEIEGCIILGLNSHRHMNGFQEITDATSIQCLHRKLGYEN